MKELAQQVIHLTGSSSRIEYRDLPEEDPKQREPEISRAKGQLDWSPRIELNEGLTMTIEYFKTLKGLSSL